MFMNFMRFPEMKKTPHFRYFLPTADYLHRLRMLEYRLEQLINSISFNELS